MGSAVDLNLDAELSCEMDGHPVSIEAGGGRIIVRVNSMEGARVILARLRRLGRLRAIITRVAEWLVDTSLRLEFRLGDVVVMSMGSGIPSGILRLAGMRNVRLWVRADKQAAESE